MPFARPRSRLRRVTRQTPNCLLHGQQHFQFSLLREVRYGWPIMTNVLFARGRSPMDAMA
jgi:hypothetical protein